MFLRDLFLIVAIPNLRLLVSAGEQPFYVHRSSLLVILAISRQDSSMHGTRESLRVTEKIDGLSNHAAVDVAPHAESVPQQPVNEAIDRAPHKTDGMSATVAVDDRREVVQNGIEKHVDRFPSLQHVIPPLNFAMVSPGVYRSGYPNTMNHGFLKSLKLKTLIYLCPENCNEANVAFCQENGINIMQFGIQGNKEPFTDIPEPVRDLLHASTMSCVYDLEITY